MKKRRVLKKWLSDTLLVINTLIFTMLAMLESVESFKNVLIMLVILLVNSILLYKYDRKF